jgi:homospermidine synthase
LLFCSLVFSSYFSRAGIYLDRPGALTNVRTWTPASGPFHGMLITHTEAISIADYFSKKDEAGKLTYRPTVHFAYHACDNAWMSLHQVAGREWVKHPEERLMIDEISTGRDELGVLLMGHKKGAYWFGSDLTIEKTRELVPSNNATSLQVCTGVLTGVVYAYENPRKGQQHTQTRQQRHTAACAEFSFSSFFFFSSSGFFSHDDHLIRLV